MNRIRHTSSISLLWCVALGFVISPITGCDSENEPLASKKPLTTNDSSTTTEPSNEIESSNSNGLSNTNAASNTNDPSTENSPPNENESYNTKELSNANESPTSSEPSPPNQQSPQSAAGETQKDDPTAEPEFPIKWKKSVPEFDQPLTIFETVFWDPRDTESLRDLIQNSGRLKNKTVLEIGTGSGLISLCCLKAGAKRAIATDVNPAAIANAKYNAKQLGLSKNLEVRRVDVEDRAAYAVIKPDEKFDFIISNPPWVNQKPESIDEYALYDENFLLLKSMLAEADQHLKPDGQLLLAYGCVDAIKTILNIAGDYELEATVIDSRNLETLPEEFLPGMLIQLERK